MGNAYGMRYGSMPRRYTSPMCACNRTTVQQPSCDCAVRETRTAEEDCAAMVLAMAYVLSQQLDTVYEPENGFSRGTIFPELDKPLLVGGTCRG